MFGEFTRTAYDRIRDDFLAHHMLRSDFIERVILEANLIETKSLMRALRKLIQPWEQSRLLDEVVVGGGVIVYSKFCDRPMPGAIFGIAPGCLWVSTRCGFLEMEVFNDCPVGGKFFHQATEDLWLTLDG